MNNTLTVENLEEVFGEDVSKASDYVRSLLQEYPTRPVKPRLVKAGSAEAMVYAEQLLAYENAMVTYKEKEAKYREESGRVHSVLEEYMKKISGLYDHVPVAQQSKVWSKAWSDGHSAGYSEVYYNLRELVDLFITE